jgi:3D (Asp-Asp-Asp) domain-containing protein
VIFHARQKASKEYRVDGSSIIRIITTISIFSLVNMPFGVSPVFGQNTQSDSQKIETISPLSQEGIFILPRVDAIRLGRTFPSLDIEILTEDKKGVDKIENEEGQACRLEMPRKQIQPCVKKNTIIKKELIVTATAYSSTVAQTDSSPCTTANGYNVCKANQEDVIAANFLPFGTKVKFPDVYGDKIFTVQDRMHPRFNKRVDLWMKTTDKARKFGVKKIKMHVVEEQIAGNF